MIRAIDLKTSALESYLDEYSKPLSFLSDVRHINVFVGENNSGKSRLMRALLNSKDAVLLTDEVNASFSNEINTLR